MITPALVEPSAMEGTGFLGQAAENVYRLEADDLYLVGTAEVPLAAYHSDEILARRHRCRCATPASRRASAARPAPYGKDTRGIIRVHQFDKVEMFSFSTPEDAQAEHERLLAWEREFLDLLEIPYRVIDVATGDLGVERRPQVRHRGVDPDPGQVPGGHLDVQLHRVPGPSAERPDARGGGHPSRGDAQRDAGGDAPRDRRDPGEPSAGRRFGEGAGAAAGNARHRCHRSQGLAAERADARPAMMVW